MGLYRNCCILILTIFTLLVLVQCSQPKQVQTATQQSEGEDQSKKMAKELERMNVSGVDLYHHDPKPTFGGARKPTLWLHAKQFSVIDENTWDVADVQAVVYDIRTGAERIRLSANRGFFDKERGASLTGNVKAEMERIEFRTNSIEWMNATETEPSRVWTKGEVELEGEELYLRARSLVIYPDSREFELNDVTGQAPLSLKGTL